jgi:mRNA interferase HigB
MIKKQTIEDFALTNPQCRNSFKNWLATLKEADWGKPEDITCTFNSADNLGNGSDRVVFDIGGNKYRMICKGLFGAKKVHLFICWIGTHAEYTELCKGNKQYTINSY